MTSALHLHRRVGARVTVESAASEPVSATAPDHASNAGSGLVPKSPKPAMWRRIGSLLITLLIVVSAIFLWPVRLGGSTRLVIVSGHSMEPTYDLGDIVVARDGTNPDVGDVVVFAVPEGTGKGTLVIHRVLEVDADGYFVTQGDNRDTPDQWKLTDGDIVGEPLLRIPKGGVAVEFLQQVWVLAIILALLVVFLLWPSSDDEVAAEVSDELETGAPPEPILDTPDVDVSARPLDDTVPIPVLGELVVFGSTSTPPERDLDSELFLVGIDMSDWTARSEWVDDVDSDVMAQAEAWLDAQLVRPGR